MPQEVLRLGVVGVFYPPANAWAKGQMRPVAVMADLPPLEPGSPMTEQDGAKTVYLGDFALVLHSGETRHYIDNLRARQPSVWVAMIAEQVQMLTIDPYEGEALASDVERVVEALPMPPQTMARIEGFVAEHHVEETFHKRKRRPATSPSDPRAPRVLSDEEKWVHSRGRAGRPEGKPS